MPLHTYPHSTARLRSTTVGAHRGAGVLAILWRSCDSSEYFHHGVCWSFGRGSRDPSRHSHLHRRRLRMAPGGSTRHRCAPRPRCDAFSRMCPRRSAAATIDPVSVGSSIFHPPGLPPAQALRPVEALAMGESRGGSPVGHYTSCGNRAQRISLRLVRSVDWLRRDCIRVRKQ